MVCMFLLYSLQAQEKGYQIDLTVKGLSGQNLILGHYFGKSMYPDDTLTLDKAGQGIFSGSKTLIQGLYVVFFEDGSYFEIMMGKDQHFALETDTVNYVQNLVTKGSKDNEIFVDFQRFMLNKQDELAVLQEKLKNTENEKDKELVQEQIFELGKQRIAKIKEIRQTFPELFVSTFLSATLEAEVPDSIKDDARLSYAFYKNHFFDYFDLADVRLLHTPLYEDKMNYYLDKVVAQVPDSLILEIDMVLNKSLADSALFRFVLITLFNKYGKSQYMGMDAVQVHIAEKYYIPMAWWSDEKFVADLKERVAILKPLLIGQVAPDVELRYVPSDHFKQAANDTSLKKYPHAGSFFKISQIEADFTILVFWEANCSHCKIVVPELYRLYTDSLKAMNIQVVAVSTLFGEDGKEKWVDFVNQKQLYDWINAWNPYDYKFKEIYDIRSTPQIFVLDRNKKIIGKRLGPSDVADLINVYKKYNK